MNERTKLLGLIHAPPKPTNATEVWELPDTDNSYSNMYHEACFMIVPAAKVLNTFKYLEKEELDISEEGNVLLYMDSNSNLWQVNTQMLFELMSSVVDAKLPEYLKGIRDMLNL